MESDYSQAATALLTEHLEYTPLSLIDDIVDSVNNFIYQGIGSLETGLFTIPPERLGFKPSKSIENSQQDESQNPEAKQEIEEGLHKLETLLNAAVDKNFDKLEIYILRNILCVPADLLPWMRLSHYEDITYPLTDNAPSPESIHLLRRKLAASRNVSKAIDDDYNRNEMILSQLRGLTTSPTEANNESNFSFITNSTASRTLSGQEPLTTNTNFVLSQLPALKSLLTELRSRMSILKQGETSWDTAKDEMRQERREYIEQRTKAYLNRSGQMAGDNSGPIAGKSVEPNEVEALEKIAGKFVPP